MNETVIQLYELLSFGGILISPLYLVFFAAIAWLIYRSRGETGGFLRWLFPRKLFLTRSTGIDVSLFVISQIIQALGLFARFAATPVVDARAAKSENIRRATGIPRCMRECRLTDIMISPRWMEMRVRS